MAENKTIVANFDQILANQLEEFQSISRHVTYLNSLPADRRTATIYRNRSLLLENMWRICRERHSLLIQIADPDQKENDYFKKSEFGSFELQFYEELDNYSEIIQELQPTIPPAASSTQINCGFNDSIHQQPASVVKLPRISLPSFSGLFSEWQSFKDSFASLVIDDKTINNLAKLHFLKSTLTGEALDLIYNVKVTSDNFNVAWDLLTSRYDNKRAIVTAHLNAIFSLEPLKKESSSGLLQIFNTIQKHLAALKNLGRPTDDYSDILINRVSYLLDFKTQRDWELSLAQTTDCPKYSDLEKFLLERIRVLESIPLSNATSAPKPSSQTNQKFDNKSKRANVNAHMTSANNEVCSFCNGNHVLYKCFKFLEMSIQEKYDFAKLNKICTNCLRFQHKPSECKSKFTCLKCKKHHHTILHRDAPAEVNLESKTKKSESSQQNTEFQVVDSFTSQTHYTNSKKLSTHSVLLATARVWVISNKGRAIRVRALLDPGSTCSFISKDLSKLLNSRCIPVSASLSVLGGASVGRATSAMEIGISPELKSKSVFKTNALIIPKVTDYIPKNQLNLEDCSHLIGLSLADDPYNNDTIHLLIGAELYSSLILNGIRKGSPDHPIAINSIFGWILTGKLSEPELNNESNIQVHHCLTTKSLNASIQRFWEVEEIPFKHIMSPDDELCEEHFRKTHCRVPDGRYKVALPFTTEKPIDIGLTRHIAEKSLTRLEYRLNKNPENKKSYDAFMKDYEVQNHMKIAPSIHPQDQVVYSPHHPVIRITSQTTKVRAVFNSSVPSTNGTSLNDHLRIGPKLQTNLCMVLLNWR